MQLTFAAVTKLFPDMKQIETIASAAHFTAVDLGPLKGLGDYELALGGGLRIAGKIFGGAAVGATGAEFSLQRFAAGSEAGFLHTHKNHEELYFVLAGAGEFRVDDRIFPVREGSVVRVAPAGRRTLRNNGSAPLTVLCIQYRSATFTAEDAADYTILDEAVRW